MNNFNESRIYFKSYVYEGDIKNDKANGMGKLFFQNDWIFDGLFLDDDVIENQQTTLMQGTKVFNVSYLYIENLKMKVFKTEEGKIFSINKNSGELKLIN